MYRFFPSVFWNKGYPNRKDIVDQVEKVWKTYKLQDKTSFNYKVESVKEDDNGRWTINDNSDEKFDGIIAAVGSCGDPKVPHVPGQEKFKGQIYHSSELDGKDVKGKTVLIIGGGASAIEAMEFTTKEKAKKAKILSRSEKWIIPRNPIIDMLLAFNILGQETMFSWIPERLLRKFFYRDLADIAPPPGSAGLFEETPMVNNDVLEQIRSGNAEWLRGDILEVEENGIRFNRRQQGVPKNGPGHETLEEGEVIIMATGYKRPSLSFLPEECFAEPYSAPNWCVLCFTFPLMRNPLTLSLQVSSDFPSTAQVHLCQQLHLRRCHWYSWKFPHRHLHPYSAHVPPRSAYSTFHLLDAVLGRHDQMAQGVCSYWRIRFLHL